MGNLNTETLRTCAKLKWCLMYVLYSVCQHCRETNTKFATMDLEDKGDLVMPRERSTVMGSSFIGAGTHILLDTSLRVAQVTKATLTVMNCMCLVILLPNNTAEASQHREGREDLKVKLAARFLSASLRPESKQICTFKFKSQ